MCLRHNEKTHGEFREKREKTARIRFLYESDKLFVKENSVAPNCQLSSNLIPIRAKSSGRSAIV